MIIAWQSDISRPKVKTSCPMRRPGLKLRMSGWCTGMGLLLADRSRKVRLVNLLMKEKSGLSLTTMKKLSRLMKTMLKRLIHHHLTGWKTWHNLGKMHKITPNYSSNFSFNQIPQRKFCFAHLAPEVRQQPDTHIRGPLHDHHQPLQPPGNLLRKNYSNVQGKNHIWWEQSTSVGYCQIIAGVRGPWLECLRNFQKLRFNSW